MRHRSWIAFSGYLWFFLGALLLSKGVGFLKVSFFSKEMALVKMFHSERVAFLALFSIGLALGFFKSRFVFSKTVRRVVGRITAQKEPVSISRAYSPFYWLLIFSMMLLGMLFRFLPISPDVRGVIDIAIGSALINGAMLYFKAAKALRLTVYGD